MYVALAEVLGVPLLTDDAKFAGSAGHRAEIHRFPLPPVQRGRSEIPNAGFGTAGGGGAGRAGQWGA
ncbi:hypothetical protein [Nonomuraea sp. NPDC005501]|uniref:hypothetical protein n=1 Tax=Nonomuraea sp. NPDC005501 TaxID=3156884 RepID=UPI0033BDEB24